jgi:gamma-glutamylputrescine oxidase
MGATVRKIPATRYSVMSMHSTKPLWVDPDVSNYPPVQCDLEAEVAVIGGGIAGVATMRWLLDCGIRDIVMLEARTLASSASGRNAGFVMAVAPENFPPTDDPRDLATARRIWAFTAENQRLIEATISEFGLEAEYRRLGSLGLAAYPAEWEWILASTQIARQSGLEVELVPRDALESPWLRDHYHGGAWYPGNAEIHPAKFVRGLAASLARQGARFFEYSPVSAPLPEGLRTSGGGTESEAKGEIELHVSSHTVRVKQAVVTTNAYTSELVPSLGRRIAPIRGQVLATAPLTKAVASCPVYANDGFQYWRQTLSRRLVLGGWRDMDMAAEVGTVDVLNQAIQTELERVAVGLCGNDVQIDHRWSGIMGFTPDRRPLVGLIPGAANVAICAGFSGHGLAMAFHSAKLVVDILGGMSVDYIDLFAPDRFEQDAISSRTSAEVASA